MRNESHIKEFEKNQKWFLENFEGLVTRYKDKFVAVWNQEIIDDDFDLVILAERVQRKTMGAKGIYIEFVSDKPMEMIL